MTMAMITETLQESVRKYHDFMAQSDPRMDGSLMMKSPWPIFIISLLYFYLVLSALPRFMKSRQPLQLRQAMVVYNFGMVFLSGYIFFQMSIGGWLTGYRFIGCEPVDYTSSPKGLAMVAGGVLFVHAKVFELLDTIFFILRKKSSQVTFLHVFHHGVLPTFFWFGVKFAPGGFGSLIAWINSFVHLVMYFYYGMSALGPKYQKYLWWKKYMTTLQLVQFVTVILHSVQGFYFDCGYPRPLVYILLGFCSIFFVLFMDFFVKAYLNPSNKQKSLTNGTRATNGSVPVNGGVPMATNGSVHMRTNGSIHMETNGVMNGHMNNNSSNDKKTKDD